MKTNRKRSLYVLPTNLDPSTILMYINRNPKLEHWMWLTEKQVSEVKKHFSVRKTKITAFGNPVTPINLGTKTEKWLYIIKTKEESNS